MATANCTLTYINTFGNAYPESATSVQWSNSYQFTNLIPGNEYVHYIYMYIIVLLILICMLQQLVLLLILVLYI